MGRGREPKYKTPDELQTKIDEYFESCKGEYLKKENGEHVMNKFGEPVIINAAPPSITALSLHLGFAGRTALWNYKAKSKDFEDTITRAKSRIEAYAESRLYDKDGCRGAMFYLAVNSGWKEEKDARDTPFPVKIVDDV